MKSIYSNIILFSLAIAIVSLFLCCKSNIRKGDKYQKDTKEVQCLYDLGKYPQAIEKMKTLIGLAEKETPSLVEWNNLGNAYYKNGELGYAILSYERALKINPRNKVVRHNLMIAKSQTIDKEENSIPLGKQLWSHFCYIFPVGWIYTLSILFTFLFVSTLLLYICGNSRKVKQWGFYSALVSLLIVLLSCTMINKVKKDYYDKSNAIIVVGQSSIRSEPNSTSTLLFKISEGGKVKIITMGENNWYYIQYSPEKKGWISSDDLAVI